MVFIDAAVQIVVAVSAATAAAAAIGIYHRVDALVDSVQKHERTLYGEADVEAWDGLVERVADHEAELEAKRDDE